MGDKGDAEAVAELLGRPPQGDFEVVVRRHDGRPVVIRNSPFLDDGTPMPTRYWLVDPELRRVIGGVESAGGVRQAEVELDPVAVEESHRRYAAEREQAIPPGHTGPRPSGGVGGTRTGVKCLHAHYAFYLGCEVGRSDPVGEWVHAQLRKLGVTPPIEGTGTTQETA